MAGGALIVLPVAGVLVFNAWAAAKLDRALEDLRERGEPTTVAELYALLQANAPADEHNLAKVPALLALQDSEEGRAARELLAAERPHHLDLLDKSDLEWGRASDIRAGSATQTAEDFDQWHPDNQPDYFSDPEPHWQWVDHPDGPAASIYGMSAFLHQAIQELAAETRHRSGAFWTWTELDDDDLLDLNMNSYGPDLGQTMRISQTLRSIALAALERDDPELALCAVELQLALSRSISPGSGLIGGLVAATGVWISDAALYDGLRRQAWDEEQLLRLQSALKLSFPVVEIQPFLQMGRISGMAEIRWGMRERGGAAGGGFLGFLSPIQRILLRVLPDGSFHLATLALLGDYEEQFLQPGAPLPAEPPEDHRQRPGWLQWLDQIDPLQYFVVGASTYHRIAVRCRAAETRLRLAHAAVALELFYLRHGRYPDTWREMIPEVLAEVPLDPFTGGEMRLLAADEEAGRTRPVICSLGLNRTDDGGVQASGTGGRDDYRDVHPTGDVVWGYPEEEEEG